MIRIWNALPESVVAADSVMIFRGSWINICGEENCRVTGKGQRGGSREVDLAEGQHEYD